MTGGRGDTLPQGVPMKLWRLLILICILLLIVACAALLDRPAPPPPLPDVQPPVTVPKREVPPRPVVDPGMRIDDLDLSSLETAIERSLRYYDKTKNSSFWFGNREIPVSELKASLAAFREIIRSADPDEVKMKRLQDAFEFIPSPGQDGRGTVVFTGYYVPVLEGSPVRTDRYRYPLYKRPDDLIVVNPGKLNNKYKGEPLIGRMERDELIPYYTRDEIDRKGVLAGRDLEFVWVDDPIALYSLHVQGSGKIRMPDGRTIMVSYAQSNGRPFRSLSRALVEKGKITPGDVSYPRIQQYLRENPEELMDLFSYNDRYIFFRQVEKNALGSLGVPVTSGRTIATDPDVFPKGALAFIKTRKPVFDTGGQVSRWIPFSRFVLNQDMGSAIKGPGRADLFCGEGPDAERLAGSFSEKGEIYILIRKK
jgi:membrane-bound lytic murein transglycosylase A